MVCPNPINIKPKGKDVRIDVPCGKCIFCLERRRSEWTFRIKKELKQAVSAYFLTLTYDDKWIPYTKHDTPTLRKRDFQLFMKKFRKFSKKGISIGYELKNIKYYAVGEYGSKTIRPHYHAIVMNVPRETIERLPEIWDKGFTKTGTVTDASIHYVTGYVMAKGTHPAGKAERPFSLMSKGIGKQYLKNNEKYHKENGDFMVSNNNYKQVLPRYYKDKIFDFEDKRINNVQNKKRMDERILELEKKYEKRGESYHERRMGQIESKRILLEKRLIKNKKI